MHTTHFLRFLPVIALLLSGLSPSRAQTPPPVAPTAPTPPPAIIERTIYTPYEELERVFEKEDRGVFLPYREFLDLWNKLNLPADLKKNQPPVDGILASARYTGRIEDDAAVFDAVLQLEALKDGWSRVPLGGPDLNIAEIKSATAAPSPSPSPATSPSPTPADAPAASPSPSPTPATATATLHLAENGYEAILPARGSYPIALTVLGKITRDAGRSTLALRLPRTAASQFELVIPDTGLEFTLTPASAFTSKEENGATRLAAFFGSSQDVSISWRKRAAETTLPALVFAETALETSVTPGALRSTATVDFRILRAGVSKFELVVPAGQQVLAVEGSDVRDWTVADARIVVNLATPAREKYRLRVTLESPIAKLPAKLTVPTLEIAGAEGQSGTVTVTTDPALNVTVDPREGVTQQGVPAAPAVDSKAPSVPVVLNGPTFLGAFRFLRLPYAVDLAVQPAEPVVEAAAQSLLTVDTDTLSLRSRFHYTVKKAGIFSVQIDLPAAFAHVEATGDSVAGSSVVTVPPGTRGEPAAGQQRVEVRLKERRTGEFDFNLTADAPRAKPDEPVTVAVPRPVGVSRAEGRVGVAVHQSLDPNTTAPGDLRQEPINSLNVPAPDHADTTPLALGFTYRGDAPKPAQLAFTLRKPRVSAEVRSVVALHESFTGYNWTVRYNIEYAGIDELILDAPADLAPDLQFDGPDIKEKVLDSPADGKPAARRVWHIKLQRKKLGEYRLSVSIERPLPPLAVGKPATIDWPELKTVGLFRETGQIAVVKDGNLEITHATPTGLELIDPKELTAQPGAAASADVFLAYRYAAHPAALKLEFSKNEFLPVPTALVSYAVINTVLTADRAETTEAIYWVRNNGRQFLSVVLPARGQMLSDVFVNGVGQQPSKRPDKNALLVRLPARTANASANADEAPISVRLVYSVPGDGKRMGTRGSLVIVPPLLEDIRIFQTQLNLYLPSGYRYVDFYGPMREIYSGRGWSRLREWLDPLVPALGPDAASEPAAQWQDAPPLPQTTGGGFDSALPKEGAPVVLRRLDNPAPVAIAYRSLAWANTLEALAFFLALGGGLLLLGASRRARLTYFFVVGIGAMILAGAVAPRAAGLWTAVYLGVLLAALAWLVAWPRGLVRRFQRLDTYRHRVREWYAARVPAHRPQSTPPVEPVADEPAAPEPPPSGDEPPKPPTTPDAAP